MDSFGERNIFSRWRNVPFWIFLQSMRVKKVWLDYFLNGLIWLEDTFFEGREMYLYMWKIRG